MRKSFLPFYLFAFLPFLMGCSAESEYTSWPCRFVYDNSVHLDQTLATATNAQVTGVFCQITEDVRGGVKYLSFATNDGQSSQQPETAEEQRMNYRIGLNNGIIVGFRNDFSGFAAYDIQCPNCVRKENNMANPNYRIRMDNTGMATCSKCGKKYNLNIGGIIVNGEDGDKGLERYRNAITSGPQGTTSVFSQ